MLRGYSGYNTRWALRVLDEVLSSVDSPPSPAALTLFFGANDAALADRSSAFQHVPLHEYRRNLMDLIARIKVELPLATTCSLPSSFPTVSFSAIKIIAIDVVYIYIRGFRSDGGLP